MELKDDDREDTADISAEIFDTCFGENNKNLSMPGDSGDRRRKIKSSFTNAFQPFNLLETSQEIIGMLDKIIIIKFKGKLDTHTSGVGQMTESEEIVSIDFLVQQIKKLNKEYDCNIPLVLMNSCYDYKDIQKVLSKYTDNDVRIHCFEKCQYPNSLRQSTSMEVDEMEQDSSLHDDVLYRSFYNSELLEKLMSEGKEYLFMSNMDLMKPDQDAHSVKESSCDYKPLVESIIWEPNDTRCAHVEEYLCYYCHKSFSTLPKLVKHVKIHSTVDLSFACMSNRQNREKIRTFEQPNAEISNNGNDNKKLYAHNKENVSPDKESFIVHNKENVSPDKESFIVHNKENVSPDKEPFINTDKSVHSVDNDHIDGKPYQCMYCNNIFDDKAELNDHEMIHRRMGHFDCSECGKTFKLAQSLKQHKETHFAEKSFLCKFCGKTFAQSGNLKLHENIHTGENQYPCDVCKKVFVNKSNLKKHELLHSGEKPYECVICGKRFNKKAHEQRHQKVHTGERPWECEHCGKRFGEKHDVVKHQTVHTKEKAFECADCGKCFARIDHLKRHEKNIHGN